MKISETINEKMQRRQLILYEHIRRTEENRIPTMLRQYKPTYKKKSGSPIRTWFDEIRETMEKRGMKKEWSPVR